MALQFRFSPKAAQGSGCVPLRGMPTGERVRGGEVGSACSEQLPQGS